MAKTAFQAEKLPRRCMQGVRRNNRTTIQTVLRISRTLRRLPLCPASYVSRLDLLSIDCARSGGSVWAEKKPGKKKAFCGYLWRGMENCPKRDDPRRSVRPTAMSCPETGAIAPGRARPRQRMFCTRRLDALKGCQPAATYGVVILRGRPMAFRPPAGIPPQ